MAMHKKMERSRLPRAVAGLGGALLTVVACGPAHPAQHNATASKPTPRASESPTPSSTNAPQQSAEAVPSTNDSKYPACQKFAALVLKAAADINQSGFKWRLDPSSPGTGKSSTTYKGEAISGYTCSGYLYKNETTPLAQDGTVSIGVGIFATPSSSAAGDICGGNLGPVWDYRTQYQGLVVDDLRKLEHATHHNVVMCGSEAGMIAGTTSDSKVLWIAQANADRTLNPNQDATFLADGNTEQLLELEWLVETKFDGTVSGDGF